MKTDLSIIIVNYKSWDKLQLCLESILNQSQIKALITKTKSKINKKVKELDFIEAKNLRDFLFKLEGKINA